MRTILYKDSKTLHLTSIKKLRLSRFLSLSGVAARRKCEQFIRAGDVTVNGATVTDPAFSVSDQDDVLFMGALVTPFVEDEKVVIAYHKPVGVVSTMKLDREQGISLSQAIDIDKRIFPIGRLDKETSGLLLLTNDGDLAHQITHPALHIEKEYLLKTNPVLNQHKYTLLIKGVTIDDRIVELDDIKPAPNGRIFLTIHEGRKRIIRRLMRKIGLTVTELKRVRVGNVRLGRLGIGRWRKLKPEELVKLHYLISPKNK